MKRTRNIVLLLSGALATTALPSGCAPHSDEHTASDTNSEVQFGGGDEQENDSYVPGVGYYHAPYHAWFPFRWNFYREGSGYYYGGDWHPAPYSGTGFIYRSRPSSTAIFAARSFLRPNSASGVTRSSFFTSRPSTPTASHSSSSPHSSSPSSNFSGHSVTHGGFGGTAHGSSS